MDDLATFASAIAWLQTVWTGRDMPPRIHERGTEPSDLLGSPRMTRAFIRYISAGAFDAEDIETTEPCPRLVGGFSVRDCPACEGEGIHRKLRRLYRDPLWAAIASLQRNPGTWPRHTVTPAELIVVLAVCGWSADHAAMLTGLFRSQVEDWGLLAIRRLRGRYRSGPNLSRVNFDAEGAA